jgi:hypothetical protein
MQMEFTKLQLEELYGPLVYLIMEGQYSFSEATIILSSARKISSMEHVDHENQQMDASSRFGENISDTIVGRNYEAWKYWVDNEFLPRNEKIKDLIANQTHLIEGEEMPTSWLDFIEHHNSWKSSLDRWQKGLAKYPLTSRTPWPRAFDDNILSTFSLLKKRQSDLMGIIVGSRN